MRKYPFLIFTAFLLAQCALFALVSYAATCVGGGNLLITSVPSSVNFPSIDTSAEDVVHSITYDAPILFKDMRGTEAGFTISVRATDFVETTGLGFSFDVTNLKIVTDDNDTVDYIDCDDATGITLNKLNFVAFTDTDDNGTSDSTSLVTGGVRERIGRYDIDPEIELTIPAYTRVGTYRTTLIFTII